MSTTLLHVQLGSDGAAHGEGAAVGAVAMPEANGMTSGTQDLVLLLMSWGERHFMTSCRALGLPQLQGTLLEARSSTHRLNGCRLRSSFDACSFAADAHLDLRGLRPQQGGCITSRLSQQLAFGLLPADACVSWGYFPIGADALAAQQPLSLSQVCYCSCSRVFRLACLV